MSAKIIDGKKIAGEIREELREEIGELRERGVIPGLSVIIVGGDPASQVYVKNKKKMAEELGMNSQVFELSENVSQEELLSLIFKLNKDKSIHGILVQLPLPRHINEKEMVNSITPEKDVDCFNPCNFGKIMLGEEGFLPCTPAGVIELLERSDVEISGKDCVVVGRSNIVGKPLSGMLLNKSATITVCHSKTKDLARHCLNADILVAAVGKEKFIKKNMVKSGAVVIDVGINRDEFGKLCGDVDFSEVKEVASAITPVPGGVGPMTIAMLMRNTVRACEILNPNI